MIKCKTGKKVLIAIAIMIVILASLGVYEYHARGEIAAQAFSTGQMSVLAYMVQTPCEEQPIEIKLDGEEYKFSNDECK